MTPPELMQQIAHIENHAWDGRDDVVIKGLREMGLRYVAELVKDKGRLERASDILGDEDCDNEEAIGLLITAGLVDIADVVRAWTNGRKRQAEACKLIDQQLGVAMGCMRRLVESGGGRRAFDDGLGVLLSARRDLAQMLLQTEAT